MYTFALLLHSWLRWAAVLTGIMATAAAFTGRSSKGDANADRWGMFFTIALDLQLTIGLLLYFWLSPNTRAMFSDFGGAMRDPNARFWAVEHGVMMIAAVALAHIGRSLARKAPDAKTKQKRLMICFTLATLAMLAAIPWPGMANGRPLFRL